MIVRISWGERMGGEESGIGVASLTQMGCAAGRVLSRCWRSWAVAVGADDDRDRRRRGRVVLADNVGV